MTATELVPKAEATMVMIGYQHPWHSDAASIWPKACPACRQRATLTDQSSLDH